MLLSGVYSRMPVLFHYKRRSGQPTITCNTCIAAAAVQLLVSLNAGGKYSFNRWLRLRCCGRLLVLL
jgi:hypothetical protein